jgi:hypothetical protein
MDARYVPPRRRRSAWQEGDARLQVDENGYDEDVQQARRVAAAMLDALHATGYRISRVPPPHHHTP